MKRKKILTVAPGILDRFKLVFQCNSNEQLAEKTGLELSEIEDLEQNESAPVATKLIKIALVRYNINPLWLLMGRGKRRIKEIDSVQDFFS